MKMSVVGVSGASGYIGSAICQALKDAGHVVIRLGRDSKSSDREFTLAKADSCDLSGMDTLIHCAWDLTASSWEAIRVNNIAATQTLIVRAKDAGIAQFIFISSMAAFVGCQSMYGRSKLLVEEAVLASRGTVVRPGTVYGGSGGGIVRAITGVMRRFRIAPLIGGGKQTLCTVHIDDLTACIAKIVEVPQRFQGARISAAHRTPIELQAFLEAIARSEGVRPVYVPIPAWLLYWPLRLLERLGCRVPLRSDAVVSITSRPMREEYFPLPPECAVGFRPI
jgi:nucleoside-diphosphate-sugar epimerase